MGGLRPRTAENVHHGVHRETAGFFWGAAGNQAAEDVHHREHGVHRGNSQKSFLGNSQEQAAKDVHHRVHRGNSREFMGEKKWKRIR